MSSRRTLYGVPTSWGLLCFGLFLLLIVVAATYQNNLVFVMAFLVFGLTFPAIRQTADNLTGVQILGAVADPALEGEMGSVTVTLKNTSATERVHLQLWLRGQQGRGLVVTLEPFALQTVPVPFRAPARRGRYFGPRISVGSAAPFGLLFVWLTQRPDYEVAVAPRSDGNQPLPQTRVDLGTEFSSYKPYAAGDPLGRLDWKVLARGGGWKIKEFEASEDSELKLDLEATAPLGLETRLRQLSRWIHQVTALNRGFSLKVGPRVLGPGQGAAHLRRALKILADFDQHLETLPPDPGWRSVAVRSSFLATPSHRIQWSVFRTLMILGPLAALSIASEALGGSKYALFFLSGLSVILSFPKIHESYRRQAGKLADHLSSLLALGSLVVTGTAFQWVPSTESAAVLLTLVVLCKGLELRAFRDGVVQVVAVNLVLMASLLFSQDVVRTALMVALVLRTFLLLRELNSDPERGATIGGRRPSALGIRQILSWDVAVTVPVILAFFIFFPRVVSPFSKWMESRPGAQVGFSNDMDISQLANLASSAEMAFRAQFLNGRPEPRELYWRGTVLDSADGLRWNPAAESVAESSAGGLPDGGIDLNYRITLEPRFGRVLFALDRPVAVSLLNAGAGFSQIQRLSAGQFQFRNPPPSTVLVDGKARLGRGLPGEVVRGPVGFDQPIPVQNRVSDLVSAWKSGGASTSFVVQKALEFFQTNDFVYTPEAPALSSVEDFLFRHRTGFCEHYAAGFVTLMRAAGIPSRVVIGFYGGDWNDLGDFVTVRDRHAHAWSEVWDEKSGWVRVDPTAAVSSARGYFLSLDQQSLSNSTWRSLGGVFAGLQRTWESFDFAYQSFLMGFNTQEQSEVLARLSLDGVDRKTWYLVLGVFAVALVLVAVFAAQWSGALSPRAREWKRLVAGAHRLGHPLQPGQPLLPWRERILAESVREPVRSRRWVEQFDRYVQTFYRNGTPASDRLSIDHHLQTENGTSRLNKF